MDIRAYLKEFGLSEKEIEVYLTLLKGGAQSVRYIATATKINRGTTYDILKSLIAQRLVSYQHREKHQYFIAEDPEKFAHVVAEKEREITSLREKLSYVVPELKSLYYRAGGKPTVRYYEGVKGLRTILTDVLESVPAEKEYLIYSTIEVRPYLHAAYPTFTEERVQRGIRVRVIAIGEGGQLKGLDERRWLSSQATGAPTYTILYGTKVALISVTEAREPFGVLIENESISTTQKFIFEWIWENLGMQKSKIKHQNEGMLSRSSGTP
ncbi:MAG: helix-turn-helix domain-containing protein [Patescibacteria group bacterium]